MYTYVCSRNQDSVSQRIVDGKMATQVETNTPTPLAGNGHGSDYSGFDGQFIGGSWRAGRSRRRAKDFDPFTGQAVAEIALGNQAISMRLTRLRSGRSRMGDAASGGARAGDASRRIDHGEP